MACAMLAAVGRSFSLAPKGRLARPLCAATMDVGVEAPPRLKIKSIVEAEAPESLVGTRTVIKGWARTVRAQKALGFLEVNDGSSFGGLQCVFEGEAALKELKAVSTGCAVAVEGEIVKSGGKQAIELKAETLEVVGGCEEGYPLQKKRHSLEFLRSIAHLRPRRTRSRRRRACGRAGEMFRVTSLSGDALAKAATKENGFEDDFFARSAFLTRGADLKFCDQFYGDKELLDRLTSIATGAPFVRLKYADAVDVLRAEIAKDPSKWQFPDVEFGTDLATEHERWLAETHCGGNCVFVYDYPRTIKSFYMRDNDDGETVAAFDLLAPGVGELVGGSQREERTDKLEAKMVEFGLDPEDYWWYLDLRKYGSVPHAGYGLGFDRLVCYVAAIENIRDSIPYPRYPGSATF
ncbi:asparagine-tRNA ligase [Aureococcus anophagefferens]|nr:asparagine-tRNA ligase [Aureococcus anophagefferens]